MKTKTFASATVHENVKNHTQTAGAVHESLKIIELVHNEIKRQVRYMKA
jgi:hypothetical protein